MEIVPFEKITNIPRYPEGAKDQYFLDISKYMDLIDIANIFPIKNIDGIIIGDYRGIAAYIFGSNMKISFRENYLIDCIEFRIPYKLFNEIGLKYNGVDLFSENMMDVYRMLNEKDIKTEITDVGFSAPSIGAEFFSSDFDNDLNVRLDSVTVFLGAVRN